LNFAWQKKEISGDAPWLSKNYGVSSAGPNRGHKK
jgi:hypothetical protein